MIISSCLCACILRLRSFMWNSAQDKVQLDRAWCPGFACPEFISGSRDGPYNNKLDSPAPMMPS